jgi:hypothetical protein
MVSSTVKDIQGNLRIVHGIVHGIVRGIVRGIADKGAYGAITFTCKNKMISQEAALDITAHVYAQGQH